MMRNRFYGLEKKITGNFLSGFEVQYDPRVVAHNKVEPILAKLCSLYALVQNN